jgi:hypothetical protein
VTAITVSFSGAVNAAEADNPAIYQLTTAGTRGSFDAKNAKVLPLASAAYNDALDQVVLKPRKPFALTKPVEVLVHGQSPGGLQDTTGRFIDGDGDGRAADDGHFVLSRKGVFRGDAVVSPLGGSPTIRTIAAVVPSKPPVLIGITTPSEAPGFKFKSNHDSKSLAPKGVPGHS